jgi:hypothetical protein
MIITNKQGLPAPVVALLTRNYYSKGRSQYSVTEIISPPRIKRLREQYDDVIELDVTDLIATQFGTFMHGKLEMFEIENHINEERLFTEVNGATFSGQIDLQEVRPEGVIITDYKFVKAWSAMNGKDSWETQLNIYKWLVETVKKTPVIGLNVCAFIKDFDKNSVARNEAYPVAEVVMIGIKLWDAVKTESYIRERIESHKEAKMRHDFGEDLQLCTDEERWAKETVYAVKKEGRKTAIRLFKNIEEATELAGKEGGYVETRPGEYTRCVGNYCQVSKWCTQYQSELNGERLNG